MQFGGRGAVRREHEAEAFSIVGFDSTPCGGLSGACVADKKGEPDESDNARTPHVNKRFWPGVAEPYWFRCVGRWVDMRLGWVSVASYRFGLRVLWCLASGSFGSAYKLLYIGKPTIFVRGSYFG